MSQEIWFPQDYQFPYNPNARTEFYDSSCQVIAYPSVGGLVLGFFSAVELAYLNLPRLKATNRSLDAAEEDNLCSSYVRSWRSLVA
jgi:hypothetical protein